MTPAERQARRRARLRASPTGTAVAGGASGWITITGTAHGTVLTPLPDDHPVFQLVGVLAAEGARAEYLLDLSIARLLRLSREDAAPITSKLNGPTPRLSKLRELLDLSPLGECVEAAFAAVENTYRGPFEWRNRALHDPWMMTTEGKTHQQLTRPKGDRPLGLRPKTTEELSAHIAEMRELRDQVTSLHNAIRQATMA